MTNSALSIRKGASVSADPLTAAAELHAAIAQPGISLAFFWCASTYDLDVLGAELARLFEGVQLIGCTTAGEITPVGYLNGSITGVSVASPNFHVATGRLDRVHEFRFAQGESVARELSTALTAQGLELSPDRCFGYLMVDGLCNQEEAVVSSLSRSLGSISILGGSAGDGTRFGATHVFHQGRFHRDAAVFTLVHTTEPFVVFKTQHFVSASEKMVVTKADPSRRVVTEINGEPAGLEYARVVGLEVDALTPLIFATYPVVVKVGGAFYVRSIQKVNADGSLTFFCAIDEGIVLTVARGIDLVENLEHAFSAVRSKVGAPQLVLGCDCILRHLELDQKGIKDQVASIMMANNVVGFATYGEQYNAMHVNQTFTGVAIGGAGHGG